MARGDAIWFAAFDKESKGGVSFNFGADTLKVGIVNNATVPDTGTDDPRWGAGGTTNFATNQVATATAYTGPITLAGVTWTRAGRVTKLDFNDINVAQDAGGFTDGYWAILYDDTVAGKYAFGAIDLGGPVSLAALPLVITINAAGFGADTAS